MEKRTINHACAVAWFITCALVAPSVIGAIIGVTLITDGKPDYGFMVLGGCVAALAQAFLVYAAALMLRMVYEHTHRQRPQGPQGAPPARKAVQAPKIPAIGLIVLMLIVAPSCDDGRQQNAAPARKVDASPETQAKRKQLIADLIAKGVFQKVEKPATLPHLWVRPAFYQLDFDTKRDFVSVVAAYYLADSGASMVRIFDSKTGKQVGEMDSDTGMLSMN
ncbi:MAG: hypothetical protein WD768_22725 [Phycisphaeraceae bacterium]